MIFVYYDVFSLCWSTALKLNSTFPSQLAIQRRGLATTSNAPTAHSRWLSMCGFLQNSYVQFFGRGLFIFTTLIFRFIYNTTSDLLKFYQITRKAIYYANYIVYNTCWTCNNTYFTVYHLSTYISKQLRFILFPLLSPFFLTLWFNLKVSYWTWRQIFAKGRLWCTLIFHVFNWSWNSLKISF